MLKSFFKLLAVFNLTLLQVERERNLVNSKAAEFENLLRNPYTKHTTTQSNQNPFPIGAASSPSIAPQNSGVSSFQQSPPPNMSFGVRQVVLMLIIFKAENLDVC